MNFAMAGVKHSRWDTPHQSLDDAGSNSPKTASETDASSSTGSKKGDRDSPDSGCAICLGKLENKSFTDSCFHQFCFTCLLEWSKVKAECPLCKQSFKSIIHNVRSIEDYDQYHLRPGQTPKRQHDSRRFRYRSTLTPERRRLLAIGDMLLTQSHPPPMPPFFSHHQHSPATASRRDVYRRGLRVRPLEQQGIGRVRSTSPDFFRQNPACAHRLIPWLNRELLVVLEHQESRLAFVMELVLSLIRRFSIRSPEFAIHVRPYTLHRTDHFVHELFHFARSPWDLYTYDQNAVYDEPGPSGQGPESEIITLSPESRPESAFFDVLPDESALQKVKNFLEGVASRAEVVDAPRVGGNSSSPQPGPSGVGDSRFLGAESGPEDDDCVIICEGRARGSRTPVVVDLISSSDSEGSRKESRIVLFDDSSSDDEDLPRFRSKIVCPENLKYKWVVNGSGGTMQRERTGEERRRHKKHKKHRKHHKRHKEEREESKHKCKKHYKGHKSSSGSSRRCTE